MALVSVAICYRTSRASVLISALEAAGFMVFAPGFHITSASPHTSLAHHGIQICVPRNEATDALEFLNAVLDGQVTALEPAEQEMTPDPDTCPPPKPGWRLWADRILPGIIWLFFSISPAPDMVHLNMRRS